MMWKTADKFELFVYAQRMSLPYIKGHCFRIFLKDLIQLFLVTHTTALPALLGQDSALWVRRE